LLTLFVNFNIFWLGKQNEQLFGKKISKAQKEQRSITHNGCNRFWLGKIKTITAFFVKIG